MTDSMLDSEVLRATATERLHPLSWLFILLRQLRSFAIPLILLLVTGRGEQSEADLIGVIGAAGLAVHAIWQYFTYRYGFLEHALVVRSGVFQRTLRLIPFERVQNVTLHQTLFHRLAGVAEVRLESAGGMGRPEAEMRVLRLDRAQALEARLRADAQHRQTFAQANRGRADASQGAISAEPEAALWLQLPTAELIRLGLISNRGIVLVLAGLGVLSQSGDGLIKPITNEAIEIATNGAELATQSHFGPVAYAVTILVALGMVIVAMRVLSIALAILQFHAFKLTASAGELRVERGLLTRLRVHLPRTKIQAFSLSETLLHRWFGRQSLRVDRASIEAMNEQLSIRDLVPIATPDAMTRIIASLLPQGHWPLQRWQPLHPRAWRRKFTIPALFALIACAAAIWWRGPQAGWTLLLVPLLYARARVWARYSAWTLDAGVVAFRQGWLDRNWRFAEVRKLQSLRLVQSPFDRRHGMAAVWMDTIGASPMEPPLVIPYLDIAVAGALIERLRAQMPRDVVQPASVVAANVVAAAMPSVGDAHVIAETLSH
jgi:putative membrane protein